MEGAGEKAEEGEEANILDFVSTPFPIPGELTFNRGLEGPLVLENISPTGYSCSSTFTSAERARREY